MRTILVLLLLSGLFACQTSQKLISFKRYSEQTGIYEADENGVRMPVFMQNSVSYKLKRHPTIDMDEFDSLYLDKYCREGYLCVAFVLSEEGRYAYSELTRRNIEKQIFYVIDGVVVMDPQVMDQIDIGEGQFHVREEYFDSLFVKK